MNYLTFSIHSQLLARTLTAHIHRHAALPTGRIPLLPWGLPQFFVARTFCSILTWWHHAAAADLSAAWCQSPVPPRPKGASLGWDLVTGGHWRNNRDSSDYVFLLLSRWEGANCSLTLLLLCALLLLQPIFFKVGRIVVGSEMVFCSPWL